MVIPCVMVNKERQTIRVDRQGRALIPKPMREAMGLAEGGEAVAWLEGERLVVESRARVARELKARFRNVEGSMADELIEERREEAAREDLRDET